MIDIATELEVKRLNELDTIPIRLTNLFPMGTPEDGVLGKSTINALCVFAAPYIQGVAASGYVPVSANTLPVVPAGSFTFLGAGNYVHMFDGSTFTANGFMSLVVSDGSKWSLVKTFSTGDLVNRVEMRKYLGYSIALPDLTTGGISSVTGMEETAATLLRTPLMPVSAGATISFSIRDFLSFMYFYDKNGAYLEEYTLRNALPTAQTMVGSTVVKDNVAFFRVKTVNTTDANYAPFDFYINVEGIETAKPADLYGTEINIFNLGNGNLDSVGASKVGTPISRTEYPVPIPEGAKSLEYSLEAHSAGGPGIFFFKADKSFLSSAIITEQAGVSELRSGTLDVPELAKYFKVVTVNSSSTGYIPHEFYVRFAGLLNRDDTDTSFEGEFIDLLNTEDVMVAETKINANTGTTVASPSARVTPLIHVEEGWRIRVNISLGNYLSSGFQGTGIAGFNSSGVYVGTTDPNFPSLKVGNLLSVERYNATNARQLASSGNSVLFNYEFTIPMGSGITQIRASSFYQGGTPLLMQRVRPTGTLADMEKYVDDHVGVKYSPVPSYVENLPFLTDGSFQWVGIAHNQDNATTSDTHEYITYIAPLRVPYVAQRSLLGGEWKIKSLAGSSIGNTVTSDSHNVLSVGVTKDGYVLVSGNMHNNVCRCVISNAPNDISAFTNILFSTSNDVAYPTFVTHPDGTLFVFWREGSSGNGDYFFTTFNDTTKTFNPKTEFISGQTSPDASPYLQKVVINRFGVIQIMWGFRTSTDSSSNSGMYYVESADKGVTWKAPTTGITHLLPITKAVAVRVYVVDENEGYINQAGAASDYNGMFHSAITRRFDGYTQIVHIFQTSATTFTSEIISTFDYKGAINQSVPGGLTRPCVACSDDGTTYILYRTVYNGKMDQVRIINCSDKSDTCLIRIKGGLTEIIYNTRLLRDRKILRFLINNSRYNADGNVYTGFGNYLPTHAVTVLIN